MGFSPFAVMENQVALLPRAADKTSGLKCNQILKCSQAKHAPANLEYFDQNTQ